MEQSRIDLTQAEWQVMECLWEQAPRTGREAAEYMARRTGWSRSTTLTLLQRLEDEMADRLADLCKSHRPEDSAPGQFPFLRDLYRFIRDNADLCRVLLGPNGDIAYTDRICRILRDNFLFDFLSLFYPGDRQRLNSFCSFIVSGNLNLALAWLREGGQESPDEMAQLAGGIIMGGVSALKP